MERVRFDGRPNGTQWYNGIRVTLGAASLIIRMIETIIWLSQYWSWQNLLCNHY